jgi:hypothetical protein
MAEANAPSVSSDRGIQPSVEEETKMNSEMAGATGSATADDAALQRFLQQQRE